MIDRSSKRHIVKAVKQKQKAERKLTEAKERLTVVLGIAQASGASLQELGNLLGVSRQRVHQMLKGKVE